MDNIFYLLMGYVFQSKSSVVSHALILILMKAIIEVSRCWNNWITDIYIICMCRSSYREKSNQIYSAIMNDFVTLVHTGQKAKFPEMYRTGRNFLQFPAPILKFCRIGVRKSTGNCALYCYRTGQEM